MEIKICCDCKNELKITDFPILKNSNGKSRLSIRCRICYNIKARERNKKSYIKNRDKRIEGQRDYNNNNKSKISEYKKKLDKSIIKQQQQKKYQKNRESYLIKAKIYYKNNREKIIKQKNEYEKNKKLTDPLYKVKRNIRTLIKQKLIKNNYTKKSKTHEILGCSFEEFKLHLESKFEPWMTWENYGLYNGELNYGWDIDHIIPTSSANTEDELIKLNHHTNLQPLCSKLNRDIKRNITK